MPHITVRKKLFLINVLAALGLSSLFGIQYHNSQDTLVRIAQVETLQNNVEILNLLKSTVKELNLDGMDIIVDRADGVVMPERTQAITDKIDVLFAKKKELEAVANGAEQAAAITLFNIQAAVLQKLLQEDLPNAVVAQGKEQGAQIFAVLDDKIDNTVTAMADVLAPLIVSAQNDIHTYFTATRNKANAVLLWSTGVFCLMLVGKFLLLHFIGVSIVKGINRLIHRFEQQAVNVFGELSNTSEKMSTTAQILNQSASQTSLQSATLFSTAEVTHNNMHNVAAASEELYSTTDEIKRVIVESVSIAREAMVQAETTTETMHKMSVSANEVKEVLALISAIAEKTNLLALNASIEAMRAGDLGKGFSVVASEVKSLATQTANATRTITDKVYDIQSISSTAVTAINDIQATINKINDIASVISAAVEEQGASTQEIARNCNEVAAGSKVITENINALQGVAGESNAASEGVLSAVSILEEQTNRMKMSIDAFVKGLRAA